MAAMGFPNFLQRRADDVQLAIVPTSPENPLKENPIARFDDVLKEFPAYG